jgi:hypothetical protein
LGCDRVGWVSFLPNCERLRSDIAPTKEFCAGFFFSEGLRFAAEIPLTSSFIL